MSSQTTVIAPEGDLDIATVKDFRHTVLEAADNSPAGLVVDLTGVDFIDSTGLGAVLEAHQRMRTESRFVGVVAPPGSSAALILNLSGLGDKLNIFESRSEALAV